MREFAILKSKVERITCSDASVQCTCVLAHFACVRLKSWVNAMSNAGGAPYTAQPVFRHNRSLVEIESYLLYK